jgi:hypothetical protein
MAGLRRARVAVEEATLGFGLGFGVPGWWGVFSMAICNARVFSS